MSTEEAATGLKVWDAVMKGILSIPGAKVDRAKFLRSTFGPHVADELVQLAITSTPAKAGIPEEVRRRAAESSITWHRAGVSATSLAAGLPGGFALVGTIPTDLAQYFWHVVVLSQKLAYLHGWPDLLPDGEEVDDETRLVMTMFVGVSFGVEGAKSGLNKLATALGAEAAKRLPRAALTKYAIYNIAKLVAKWIGVNLTKKKFAELVGRSIPIVGGVVAGGLTWAVFGASAKRLRTHLEGLPLASA